MKIGDKVVCVDDSPCACGVKSSLILNQVYVIEGFRTSNTGLLLLHILGFVAACANNPEHINQPVNTARATRFRLLDELKQQTKERQNHGKETPHQSPSTNPHR